MNRITLLMIAAIGLMLNTGIAKAEHGKPIDDDSKNKITIAVYGDWPYGPDILAAAPLLIESINSDPKVRLVLHVGDIHSGSQPCTGAGLSPIPVGSDPTYNDMIFDLFEQFKDPFVYTPGDNEWTDCHKTKEKSSGYPLYELEAVRGLFFADPGHTLGGRDKKVLSQGQAFNPAHPTDSQYIENVMWEDSRVVFITLNVPGSNNDGLTWTAPFTNEAARTQEVAERTAADIRWLDRAFAQAKKDRAKAVLIGIQADMWDPAAVVAGGDGLDGYDGLVQELAKLSLDFGRPVLLINGDSHIYESDQPLTTAFYNDPNTVGDFHKVGYEVPNLTRITVQGSTNKPREWLRLTIDPRSSEVFSWENVVYCDDTTCPN